MKKILPFLLILFSLVTIVFFNVGFLLLLFAFLPSIIAFFADDTPMRNMFRTVFAMNFVGILPVLYELLHSGGSIGAWVQIKMYEPNTWVRAYLGAAVGYALIFVCRWVAYLSILASSEAKAQQLEKSQKALLEEWGEEIAEFVMKEAEKTPAPAEPAKA